MFPAIAIKVLIASPSDVERECEAIEATIHRWNSLHAERQGIVLLPIRWTTHSRPEMGAPPQTILNSQIVDPSDVLIACFGHRMGTPTASSDSGTSEEIERFIATGRPAIVYFSESQVNIADIDTEQLQRRNELRARMQVEGFLGSYSDIDDLRRHVEADLVRLVQGLEIENAVVAEPQTASSQEMQETIFFALEPLRIQLLRDSVMWKSQWETRGDPFNGDAAKDLAQGIYQYLARLNGDVAVVLNNPTSALGRDIRALMEMAQQIANIQFYWDGGRSRDGLVTQMNSLMENVEHLVGTNWQDYVVTSTSIEEDDLH
ncbi:MAG TPA: hypothetical protein VMW30_05800 [Candidatus Paceibacterota bacterium]|nr:hypothetical protein [Candidatus Paceibacterota bacterium]